MVIDTDEINWPSSVFLFQLCNSHVVLNDYGIVEFLTANLTP